MDRDRRRKFGQNFLVDQAMIEAIVSDLSLKGDESILEVGPGHGAITRLLCRDSERVTSVEIDEQCVQYLKSKLKERRLTLVNQNFMDFDLESFVRDSPNSWIVGNLPYNMANPILMKILPCINEVRGCMAMVQLEVAKRLCAEPGSKDYGVLTVLLRCKAKARLLQRVPPECFKPMPNVMSGTVMIEKADKQFEMSEAFIQFVKAAFAQKRKTLYNSLSTAFPKSKIKEALEKAGIQEDIRAEKLGVDQLYQLFELICD